MQRTKVDNVVGLLEDRVCRCVGNEAAQPGPASPLCQLVLEMHRLAT
jgi:hypothetical protein